MAPLPQDISDDIDQLECTNSSIFTPSKQQSIPLRYPSANSDRMSTPPSNDNGYWHKDGATGLVLRSVLRGLQCIFAVVTAILYALDLRQATQDGVKPDSEWIYAEFVAGVSIIVCILHLFFTTAKCLWTILDGLLFILWMAQFAVFASRYIGTEKPLEEGFVPSSGRMRSAVWVDLVSMLLWLVTTIQGTMRCHTRRKNSRRKDKSIELESASSSS